MEQSSKGSKPKRITQLAIKGITVFQIGYIPLTISFDNILRKDKNTYCYKIKAAEPKY